MLYQDFIVSFYAEHEKKNKLYSERKKKCNYKFTQKQVDILDKQGW